MLFEWHRGIKIQRVLATFATMAKKNKKRKSKEALIGGTSTKVKKHKHDIQRDTCTKSDQSTSKQSLAQLLKKHRGVAATTPPPQIWKDTRDNTTSRQHNFLTPQDDPQAFEDCLTTSYTGFYYDSPKMLPSSLHKEFDSSFAGMDKGGLFLYDIVQPGKKRLTRTSVTRCLVGDPGTTYKYLGLRLFSHPWVDVDENGNTKNNEETKNGSTLRKLGYSERTTTALLSMGNANSTLINRSKSMLQEHVAPHVSPVGSADYNLTLVNKMESTSTKRDLKKEVGYGMGKISVGWHRDSGLKDFSSIAVYQSLKETSSSNKNESWGVALRAMNGGAGGALEDVPPLMIPLPSGSLYYMLDDFNHAHEHAVIAGSDGIRYSSTHRVAREGAGTWQYIRDKIQSFSSTRSDFDMDLGVVKDSAATSNLSLRKKREKLVSHLRAQQNLITEIEFEWLRQWFVQGKKHALAHPYWHQPIRILCSSYCELEEAASKMINLLKKMSNDGMGESHVTEDLFDVLIEALTERCRLRSSWKERYRDPIFANIAEDERPFSCPCLDREKDNIDTRYIPENLEGLVSQLRQWRSAFIAASSSDHVEDTGESQIDAKKSKKRKKSKSGSLTKKESKQRASNWEKLKANMKK